MERFSGPGHGGMRNAESHRERKLKKTHRETWSCVQFNPFIICDLQISLLSHFRNWNSVQSNYSDQFQDGTKCHYSHNQLLKNPPIKNVAVGEVCVCVFPSPWDKQSV